MKHVNKVYETDLSHFSNKIIICYLPAYFDYVFTSTRLAATILGRLVI